MQLTPPSAMELAPAPAVLARPDRHSPASPVIEVAAEIGDISATRPPIELITPTVEEFRELHKLLALTRAATLSGDLAEPLGRLAVVFSAYRVRIAILKALVLVATLRMP